LVSWYNFSRPYTIILVYWLVYDKNKRRLGFSYFEGRKEEKIREKRKK